MHFNFLVSEQNSKKKKSKEQNSKEQKSKKKNS